MPEKVALITGAARRTGLAIARHFHQHGYNVLIHYHQSAQDARQAATQLNRLRNNSAAMYCADLRLPESATNLLDYTLATFQRLDVLVNNASVFWPDTHQDDALANWPELFECNVIAPYRLSLTARPFLEKNQGCIVNLTDIHGEKPLKNYTLYCQTKAALILQTKALAKEFAPKVRVNSVAPGAIDWPEGENKLSDKQKSNIIAKTPLQQHGHPDYVAQAVHALAANPFITGENIKVDGGRSL